MKVDKVDVEVTVTQKGYQLTVSERELKLLRAALGKVDFGEARNYVQKTWFSEFGDTDQNQLNNELYKLYTQLYDVHG